MRGSETKNLELAKVGKSVDGEGNVASKFEKKKKRQAKTGGENELFFHTAYPLTQGYLSARQLFHKAPMATRAPVNSRLPATRALGQNGAHHVVVQVADKTSRHYSVHHGVAQVEVPSYSLPSRFHMQNCCASDSWLVFEAPPAEDVTGRRVRLSRRTLSDVSETR